MKIVFMGTPDFAVPTLAALIENHEVVGVVTQPDKRKGRGKSMAFTPVKEKALGQNVLTSVKPSQMMVKIVHDELASLMGGTAVDVNLQ